MFARIRYRFPGKQISRREGRLEAFVPGNELKGCVISPFPGEQVYVLREMETPKKFDVFSQDEPLVIQENEYVQNASKFLEEIRRNEIGKAVLSRVKKVPFDERKSLALFDRLCENYPSSFVYMLESEDFGSWIGASPEVLLECVNNSCHTIALAGTISSDGSQPWTDKERAEQRMVTEDILELLLKNGVRNIAVSDVEEFQAGPVCHLRTDIRFNYSGDHSALASKLHPTPAVSGYPRKSAIELIERFERHERILYAGFIGEVDGKECHIFVNLRCALISGGNLYLFLGGGFTENSDVYKEWLETENKARTLLDMADSL